MEECGLCGAYEHLQWIKDRRESGWSLITIWEELPIEVNRSSFYRFVKRNEADIDREKIRCRLKVSPEIIYEPGEALLLDCGGRCMMLLILRQVK